MGNVNEKENEEEFEEQSCDDCACKTKWCGQGERCNDYVKKSVWKQAQIKHAAALGLGRMNPDQIIISDEGVDNIDGILTKWC